MVKFTPVLPDAHLELLNRKLRARTMASKKTILPVKKSRSLSPDKSRHVHVDFIPVVGKISIESDVSSEVRRTNTTDVQLKYDNMLEEKSGCVIEQALAEQQRAQQLELIKMKFLDGAEQRRRQRLIDQHKEAHIKDQREKMSVWYKKLRTLVDEELLVPKGRNSWMSDVHRFLCEQARDLEQLANVDMLELKAFQRAADRDPENTTLLRSLAKSILVRRDEAFHMRYEKLCKKLPVEPSGPRQHECPRVPYSRRIVGADVTDASVQTDPQDFISKELLWSGTKLLNGQTQAHVNIELLDSNVLLIKAETDKGNVPFYHAALSENIIVNNHLSCETESNTHPIADLLYLYTGKDDGLAQPSNEILRITETRIAP
jgi:hypothetical protein